MTRKSDVRDEVDYQSDPHTRLKHAFYRRYIACWMGKVLQQKWPATIVEPFSGSGMYSDGVEGSAMVIARLYREHKCRPNFQALTAVTNDADSRRTAKVNQRLAALPPDDGYIHQPLEPSYFHDIVDDVIRHHAPAGRQTLWIIDPHGLKQIPWSAVRKCASRERNEVIITLMVDELHRYRSNPVMDSVMNEVFGDDSWKRLQPTNSTAKSKADLVRLYCEKLQGLGCHTASFDIDAVGRASRYALVFATHHTAGLACWNDAKWSSDPATGSHVGVLNEGQLGLFGPEIDTLGTDLRTKPGIYSFAELAKRASLLGYKESHLRTALDTLFREGLVLRVAPRQAPKKRPWPQDCIVQIFENEPDLLG
ncbi:methyltransferase [Gordonia phage Angelique]|nr:methyltransferase [Gordonia phage Angelique]